ncbi:MAG: hypothetical protein ACRDJE_14470 [Dehalococcoidia bacterium]
MTNEQSTDETSNGAGEQFAAGVERIGETGLELRMEFPHSKVREDFLIAFRGWLKEYKQATETAYLVQALVAEKVAAEAGDDTSGYFTGLLMGGVFAPIYAVSRYASRQIVSRYSDWMPW